MTTNLHSKPYNRERLIIPVSEFSFATFPVQVKPAIRRASAAAILQNEWRDLLQCAFRKICA